MTVTTLDTILAIALAVCFVVILGLAWLVVRLDGRRLRRVRARMASWRPARKVNVAAFASGAVVLCAWGLRSWTSVDLSMEAEAAVVSALVWVAGYLVPPSWRDTVEIKTGGGDA